ncbi:MAG: prolyl oligopeptidase family serine peptidase, partial [Flavobacteriales bacterium]|nr:prolyl oligopeptidase family serine peptidase [Flavobacteriales bacterium]
VTRTDMFACAEAGAPVSNMTSAYDGIRWESGNSRSVQYESGQSRIGGTLWERPMQYVENSPLFYAPRVNTPIMIMHNDADGAVPWYQGIEYFVALRRLGKTAWLINYNGDSHNLRPTSWGNRMDLTRRMEQFFGYYLKGEPMPQWMKDGIPATEKGKTFGF